jgi:hypothetical protein
MTPLYAITQALKKAGVIGIGETPAAEDTNDAFNELQDMLFQWQQQRWLVYSLIDAKLVWPGTESCTIGMGGDFNVLRPDSIESAYFVPLNVSPGLRASYPLELLQSREDYNNIVLKELVTWPQYLFFDSAYPLGNIFVSPIPPAGMFEIHLSIKTPLPDPTNKTSQMSLPPEYNQAIIYNLAALLCTSYGVAVPPDVQRVADRALAVIRAANTQIPRLQMPVGIDGSAGNYNPYADRIN